MCVHTGSSAQSGIGCTSIEACMRSLNEPSSHISVTSPALSGPYLTIPTLSTSIAMQLASKAGVSGSSAVYAQAPALKHACESMSWNDSSFTALHSAKSTARRRTTTPGSIQRGQVSRTQAGVVGEMSPEIHAGVSRTSSGGVRSVASTQSLMLPSSHSSRTWPVSLGPSHTTPGVPSLT